MEKNLKQLANMLELECLTGKENLDRVPHGAYSSDLLSDVMGNAQKDMLQSHKNIVAVASLKELSAIIIVNGRKVGEEVLEAAESEGVVILFSEIPAFETAGKLYNYLHDIEK